MAAPALRWGDLMVFMGDMPTVRLDRRLRRRGAADDWGEWVVLGIAASSSINGRSELLRWLDGVGVLLRSMSGVPGKGLAGRIGDMSNDEAVADV